MANRTFEIWDYWKDTPKWSRPTMYVALVLIATLCYFGCYFYSWTYWVSIVIGVSVPVVMLFFQLRSIKSKTESPDNVGGAIYSILAFIPIAVFAVLGSHALSIHCSLSDKVEEEMKCKSTELGEAVLSFKNEMTSRSLAPTPIVKKKLDELEYISNRLEEPYNPFDIGEVMKSSDEAQRILYILYSSFLNANGFGQELCDDSITKNLKSTSEGWTMLHGAVIFALIFLAFCPVIFCLQAIRD